MTSSTRIDGVQNFVFCEDSSEVVHQTPVALLPDAPRNRQDILQYESEAP